VAKKVAKKRRKKEPKFTEVKCPTCGRKYRYPYGTEDPGCPKCNTLSSAKPRRKNGKR